MQLNDEFKYLIQTLQTNPAKISYAINHTIDWDLLFQLIVRHRVWHQVYAALTSGHEEVPQPFHDRLGQLCRQDTARTLMTAAEIKRIATALMNESIYHCFIKGIMLNVQIYPSLASRPCKDIDLWVDLKDLTQAQFVFESLGYVQKKPSYKLEGFQKQYYLEHKRDIALYHEEKKIWVELHFKLEYFGNLFFPPTPQITKAVTLFNCQPLTLKDDYHLLYLMLHASKHAWMRLRWLNDIVLYIKSGQCDLVQVMDLAKVIKCEHIVEQSLLLVQTNFGQNDASLSQLIQNPSKRALKLACTAQSFIEADYELTAEYPIYHKMFFKYRWYFAAQIPAKNKLRVVMNDFFKIDKIFPYVRFSNKCSFMYYLVYPLWILKSFVIRDS
ncbi:MAG: nucleotidyltransferase family protein [Legionella sp.]